MAHHPIRDTPEYATRMAKWRETLEAHWAAREAAGLPALTDEQVRVARPIVQDAWRRQEQRQAEAAREAREWGRRDQ